MANIHPDIRPGGLGQKDLVDVLYQIVTAIQGICQHLDADSGVPMNDYEANCYTAIFSVIVEDTLGNRAGQTGDHILSPTGVSDAGLLTLLYQVFDAFETLTEQLDADVLTDSNYEALCYTALFLWMVDNGKSTLGNGNTFWFRPGGVFPEKELVDLLYAVVDAIETLTEKLDADGTVNSTDYEATYFTAVVLTRIQNSTGSVVGN